MGIVLGTRAIVNERLKEVHDMKGKGMLKKGISVVLTGAMLISGVAVSGVDTVKAASTADEWKAAYLDDDVYMEHDIFPICSGTKENWYEDRNKYGLDGTKTVAKVYLGKAADGTPLEWYIAGHDHAGHYMNSDIWQRPVQTYVLFAAQPLGTSAYNSSQVRDIKYVDSTLFKTLASYCYSEANVKKGTARFSKAEDAVMTELPLGGSDDTGTDLTDVKLYAPVISDRNSKNIVLGYMRNSTYWPNAEIVIKPQYFNEQAKQYNGFWLRNRDEDNGTYSFYSWYATSSASVPYGAQLMNASKGVVPACNLNFATINHMSIAPALTEGAYTDGDKGEKLGDVMTLRVEGYDKMASRAFYTSDSITVNKADEDGDVYLCVQGKNVKTDGTSSLNYTYSKKIDESTTIDSATIKEAVGSEIDVDLAWCEIWLEKSIGDNSSMAYAVSAEFRDPRDRDINKVDTKLFIANKGDTIYPNSWDKATTPECDTEGVEVKKDGYYNKHVTYYYENGSKVDNTIEVKAGQKYTAKANFYPKSGYCFAPSLSTADVTVDGKPATSVTRNRDGSITVGYTFVYDADLKSVTAPEPITGLVNGTEKTAEALGLPEKVTIMTEDGEEGLEVNVAWDLDNLAEGTYDPAVKEEQKFKVNGTVQLPEGISNPKDIPLNVTVDVTVAAKEPVTLSKVAITDLTAPSAGEAFDTEVTVPEGVKVSPITYTVKDSDEAVTGNAKFNTTYVASMTLSTEDYYNLAEGIVQADITVDGKPVTSFTKNEDGTIAVTYEFAATKQAALISVTTPAEVTVLNGAPNTAEGLGLPSTVTIKTEDPEVTTASVNWTYFGGYKPSKTTKQRVRVQGTVVLPEGISNANNVFLTVKPYVTILAKGEALPDTKINAAEITGITPLQPGVAVDNTVKCETVGVASATMKFLNKDTNKYVITKGKYNATYIAIVTLTPAENYVFADDIRADQVTVNGNPATSVKKNSDGTLTVRYEFAPTQKAKLTSITKPEAITDIANGAAKTVEALKLPATVAIVTQDTSITSADVTWDLENLASGTYDPEVKTEQTFTVNGTVTLPETITNADDVALTVTVPVTVAAGKEDSDKKDDNNNKDNNNKDNSNNNGNTSNGNTNSGNTSNGNTTNGNNSNKPGTSKPATGTTTAPKVGTKLTDTKTKATYVVKEDSVEYAKSTDTEAIKVTIPATVRLNGVTYKVTSIAKNAFSGCEDLTSVTIGKNVTTIGDKAFYKCTSLKKIVIPATVTKIGKSAFEKCKNLKKITIKTKRLTEKTVGAKAFKGTPKNATVKVPAKSLVTYKKFLVKKGINKKAVIKK